MVLVEITRWPTGTRGPVGRVVEVLGRIDEPGSILRSSSASSAFPIDTPTRRSPKRCGSAPLSRNATSQVGATFAA